MNFHVVMTTIRIPIVLEEFFSLVGADKVKFLIVGDHKTLEGAHAWVEDAAHREERRSGRRIKAGFIGVSSIEKTHRRWNENHDSLRTVGFLAAHRAGADVVITLDDDNSPGAPDFFERYFALFEKPHALTRTGNTWTNSLHRAGVYARGFPYTHRRANHGADLIQWNGIQERRIVFHQGLTFFDGDIDALTRQNRDPGVAKNRLDEGPIAVAGFTPVNTQNSAIVRDLLPYWWAPKWCGRHWDIVAGLLVQRVNHMLGDGGGHVTYGQPFTGSRRNEHDNMVDIRDEATGAEVVEALSEHALVATPHHDALTPAEAYAKLAQALLHGGPRLLWHLGEAMQEWQAYAEAAIVKERAA